MSEYAELLVGCGDKREKLAWTKKDKFENLTTLDCSKSCNPDVVWDLCNLPLPFEDNSFDEIHAYDVLEHTGAQGDYKFFFNQFSDFHRILKPGGIFIAICPAWNSEAAFGDPSHTRVITPMSLVFLDQSEYVKQVGSTPMTDFRHIYSADFEILHNELNEHKLMFCLRARK